jgi:hypothetical protein
MKTHLQSANPNEQSDTLLVFLPGAYLKPDEFEREGFIAAVRERHLAADSLLVDADVSYYYEQTLSDRLHTEVIEPQRAKGYKSIWLVALAPYLGRRVLGAEIKKAGGLRTWQAPTGPQPDEEPDRKLWPFFQQYLEAPPSQNLPPLYLGFGLDDRFASNHKLLADALPPGRVFTTEGGHDWPQWRQLWRNVLDVLPLPAIGRSKQLLTQSPVAKPWAIAA